MPVVEESVVIARTPQEVFDYVSTPGNLPVWDSSVVESKQIGDGAVGVGTRLAGASKIIGVRFDWVSEITEYDAPRRLVFTIVEGRLAATITHTLVAEGSGTRYTYRIDAESGLGGVFGRMADPLVTAAQGRTVRANLENLADLLASSG